jgi:hypothetical protein
LNLLSAIPLSKFNMTRNLAESTIHIVSGRDAILRMRPVLAELCTKCDQTGVMDDVVYFLSKPGALSRVPQLLLVSTIPVLDIDRLTSDDLVGAVLLYKYSVLGFGIGAFTSNDRSGRGTLVAPPALRSQVAETVCRKLMDNGAFAVMLSYCDEEFTSKTIYTEDAELSGHSALDLAGESKTARWARRDRVIPDYLPLESTFDKTLAKIGQRTRSNLRYYRRRAEGQLGCTFLPAVEMDKADYLAFNRECMYAVPDSVATWRFNSLKELSKPLFMGIKDKEGRWLSLLGGRRRSTNTEILWQLNRDGLSPYSLSIVMRSYFIEHEILLGMTRLYIEGGTSHPMRYSFVTGKVTDLAFMRRSPLGVLIPKFAKHFIKYDNELALMLMDESLFRGPLPKPKPRSA